MIACASCSRTMFGGYSVTRVYRAPCPYATTTRRISKGYVVDPSRTIRLTSRRMSSSHLEQVVVSTIAGACNLDAESISLDAHLLDLGVDSLVLTSMAHQLAVEYRVSFNHEQILDLFEANSLRDLIGKLQRTVHNE